MRKIETVLKQLYGGKILDVATGHGTAIETMQSNLKDYDEIIGIDNSTKAVKIASKEYEE
ncbi:MAG: class I SAM-dependent methyltransferase [Candidatus Cloacimonadota bacterium]|nr:class I SAM-dependent methyltransferase [Candidatus Cloacimonadota bacterium]